MRKYILIIISLCFIFIIPNTVKAEAKSMILNKSEDNKIILEQIEKSLYVRFYNITSQNSDETRRYLDITSIINADEFISISNKIANIGADVSFMMQKPHIESWDFNGISFTRELSPHWDPNPRHEIKFNEYTFVYYSAGTNTLAIEKYNLDIWNFNVPNYQDGHVYVRIVYDGVIDSLTDDQLLKKSKEQINNIRNILNKQRIIFKLQKKES